MKSILITGASSGFGANVALDLAQKDWQVFASMRDIAKGKGILEQSERSAGLGKIHLVPMDVTSPSSIEEGVASVLSRTGGRLDALLNNAGYSAMGAFEDLSDADCRRQMETNFFGALAVTRAVLPTMRSAQSGRIVMVTSNAVNTPHPMLSMYAASKWALEGWAEALAMEVAPFGIDVRVVQPGGHRTPFAQNVVPVFPETGAYREWMAMAMPGVAKLDAWGRDPHKATGPIVAALTDAEAPFRTAVGEDAVAFAALRGLLPYEARAWAMRAIVGLPASGQFTTTSLSGEDATGSVADEVAREIAAAVAAHPELARLAVAAAARAETAPG